MLFDSVENLLANPKLIQITVRGLRCLGWHTLGCNEAEVIRVKLSLSSRDDDVPRAVGNFGNYVVSTASTSPSQTEIAS